MQEQRSSVTATLRTVAHREEAEVVLDEETEAAVVLALAATAAGLRWRVHPTALAAEVKVAGAPPNAEQQPRSNELLPHQGLLRWGGDGATVCYTTTSRCAAILCRMPATVEIGRGRWQTYARRSEILWSCLLSHHRAPARCPPNRSRRPLGFLRRGTRGCPSASRRGSTHGPRLPSSSRHTRPWHNTW